MSMFSVRSALKTDAQLILDLIIELASYEKLEDRVSATLKDIDMTLFKSDPKAHVLIAEEDSNVVGFVLYHTSYSTFLCKPCIHIEDLYVREEHRGKGYGEALVKAVCEIAYEKDYGRVDWVVLDWNQPAIEFYKHIGAEELSEWKVFRLNYDGIQRLVTKDIKIN
ncbi:MAG: GNAT family N-acetyltransferase [Candidatus Paracaedibacteraceae bacterium]|nr:GNAT family N-acetyltransferase [Candidatus Paracaedibacteraceae bacterium]